MIQIGRVSLDTATLDDPVTWEQSGDQVRLTANIARNSVTDYKTLAQQLLGYVDNPWEKVVPVVWALNTTMTGFYRVLDVQVTADPMTLVNGMASVQVTLERVRGYAQALVEWILSGANRSGKPGGVTASTWHGTSSLVVAYYVPSGVAPSASAARVGPGGTVKFYTDASTYYNARPIGSLSPANWYDMAATIKVGGVAVVGRQIISGVSGWELSNGLVKIAPNGSGLDVTFPIGATPASWGTAVGISTGIAPGGVFSTLTPIAVAVLRNTPEECVIRVTSAGSGIITDGLFFADLSLRRGSRFVSVTLSGLSNNHGIKTNSVTAFSSITGGMRRTANDGDHNRLVVASAKTFSTDPVNGYLYLTSSGALHDLMVGSELNGSSAATPDLATDLRDQFFAASTETQAVRLQ